MTEALTCLTCGHSDEAHDERTGICLYRACRCVCFRLDDELEDDDDGSGELDFDRSA